MPVPYVESQIDSSSIGTPWQSTFLLPYYSWILCVYSMHINSAGKSTCDILSWLIRFFKWNFSRWRGHNNRSYSYPKQNIICANLFCKIHEEYCNFCLNKGRFINDLIYITYRSNCLNSHKQDIIYKRNTGSYIGNSTVSIVQQLSKSKQLI